MSVLISKDVVREPLFAVVPIFNPWRWKSRYKHTDRAIKHFIDSGAVVILVEVGFNRRELVYADSGLDGTVANCSIHGEFKHKYIGLHSAQELWLKENLVNVGVQHLTNTNYKWEQVCWLDSDVHFVRPNWVGECIHKLQHYSFLQMFSQARDLDPDYQMLPEDYPHASGVSFVHAWKEGFIQSDPNPLVETDIRTIRRDLRKLEEDYKNERQQQSVSDASKIETDAQKLSKDIQYPYPPRVFPGLAWACTRKAWDDVGGLIDIAVWGGADHHQSLALIEKVDGMMRSDLHRNYKKIVMQWYHRCRTHIRQNVGLMSGTVFHHFHGLKTSRGYNAKHALLAKYGFDPLRHLKKDSSGLWQLHDDRSAAFPKIRDAMRRIAAERNEDTNDTRMDLYEQGH